MCCLCLLVISSSMFPIPLFWWPGASSPDCPGSAEVTASYRTPGSHRIWACQSAWWLRSQPVGPGWAGSLLSQRDLGFVLASRQTRSWPQLGGREREKMEDILRLKPDQWETHKTLSALLVRAQTGGYFMEKKPFYNNKLAANRHVSALFDLQSVTRLQEGFCLRCSAPYSRLVMNCWSVTGAGCWGCSH